MINNLQIRKLKKKLISENIDFFQPWNYSERESGISLK